MKHIKLIALVAILISLLVVGVSYAQNAYNATYTTSITYQNVGTGLANVTFEFYPENSSTSVSKSTTLNAGAGSSLYVGSVDAVDPGFNGSAVLSSSEPIVATLVQISSDAAVKNRPLSNGFSAGSPKVLLPTVLKNQYNTTSRFSIQNVSSGSVDLTVNIFNADNPSATPIVITHKNLPSGAAQYFDMGALSQITAASFNGSATVTAVTSGTTTDANIVGTAMEASVTGPETSAFEGVGGGAKTVYMATGLCQAYGASSAYAVQNVGDAPASVVVTYTNGKKSTATIASGAKFSFQACAVLDAGTSTAATITSNQDIVAIGKVFGSGNSTAWVGATEGSDSIAMPYVRYTKSGWADGSRQRAFIAIQNIGAPLAAGDVVLSYRDLNGNEVGVHTLGAMVTGAKANSSAASDDIVGNASDLDEFGYNGGYGGSVILTAPAGSELVTVVRVQSSTGGSSVVGEDATGLPLK